MEKERQLDMDYGPRTQSHATTGDQRRQGNKIRAFRQSYWTSIPAQHWFNWLEQAVVGRSRRSLLPMQATDYMLSVIWTRLRGPLNTIPGSRHTARVVIMGWK